MLSLFSGFTIFFVIFFLVFLFHLFCWNFYFSSFLGGVRSWISSFECGFLGYGVVENSFSFTYFILLVFFVIFDLEISLLLNLPMQGVLFKNLSYYLFFIILLCFGFVVEVNKGYVSWAY